MELLRRILMNQSVVLGGEETLCKEKSALELNNRLLKEHVNDLLSRQ